VSASWAFSFDAARLTWQAVSSVSQRSSFASSSFITGVSATGKPREGGSVSSAGKILYGWGRSVSGLPKSSRMARSRSCRSRKVDASGREAR
jgi:hypothetical protein